MRAGDRKPKYICSELHGSITLASSTSDAHLISKVVEQTIQALAPLGSDYTDMLKHGFDSRWVDVRETEGKGSGAYSYSTFTVHPFVLMNYNDTVDNMFTLAHEIQVNGSGGPPAAADGFDSDMAGCMGGGPPFPDQDFTAFHCGPVFNLDSGDFVAVISIEPVPDNGPGPFQFKPLAGAIPTDALMVGGMLNNQVAATFPTGTATIMGVVAVTQSTWGMLKAAYR